MFLSARPRRERPAETVFPTDRIFDQQQRGMSEQPETKYARSGEAHIAYQVLGDGPIDLVWVPGFVSHVEYEWEHPRPARFFQRLASFSRLIRFDKRGTGLSDRLAIPTLEERMDDVRAVLDAAGSSRAALVGVSEGGPMSLLYAATYPERTSALVLYGSYARRAWAPDHPFGIAPERMQGILETFEKDWGTSVAMDIWSPSFLHDEAYKRWRATYLRLAASPGAATAVMRMNMEIDARHVLPSIGVPTLVLHRAGDRLTPVEQARHLAKAIRGAKLVELPGDDHTPYAGDMDALLDEIEEFLTGIRHGPEPDRILATVLFTDIVGSTKRAAELGDRSWRDLLEQHHKIVRRQLAKFRGREVDTAGDGFLATFDGPGRAIRCAASICREVTSLGIEVRAGLHSGECQLVADKLGGIAVHIGSRVAGLARPGEVLVSSTVKDLVVGSGIAFQDRGTHALKDVPEPWHLFAVARTDEVTE
jgi:class 3 adenylate cyclase/dienelactone hydrolase